MFKIRNMDVACNLSYTGTETASGKEEDTPFLEAIIITAVSSLLLQHYTDHSDTQQGSVLFNAPSGPRGA